MKELPVRLIPGVHTKSELKSYILTKGCYSYEENLRIYQKWFAHAPRYIFRALDRKYSITKKVLCDIGCSYGMNLIFCEPGSYGVEIDSYAVQFGHSIGLEIFQCNATKDELANLPRVDVLWCSAVLEHIEAPHNFLRKMHGLLKQGGILCVYVPTIPLFCALKNISYIGHFFSGHLAADHINAFTPEVLRFFCERAGFKTIEVTPLYPHFLSIFNHVPFINKLIDSCMYIGSKIENWEYPEKSTRRVS